MQNLPSTYKSWILKHRPTVGETLGRKHLEYRELSIPQVGEGGALLKLNFLSFDASQQIMAMGGTGYFVSDLDAPMPCLCVGTIVSVGKDSKYPVGTKLHFRGSYSEYHYLTAKELENALVVDQDIAEDDYLSVGSYTTGLTVLVGLNKIAKDNIKPGKTLVVSAASGGVGQLVIQVAKLYELRVVAITGGDDKCKDLIENYQVDAAVNYRDPNFSEKLKEACPNKVDIYWDNVGGDISDEVYSNLNLFSRVIVCGLLTDYSERKGQTYKNFANILLSRARVEGFIVWDSPDLIEEGAKQISSWLKEKKLKFEKTILDFDKAPDGITMLLSGSKKGKLLARV